ncbi:glycosyltransferase family 9 protein [Desulfoluna spongiiphila]|uniref:ADP-heptose:LPS heptosyltransferase n=1 Tax=Desulfoluna spongiiphila TaxID=419481 RepID=A0A1G5AI47_9BACT|nr:glycosyltransferase family 9 protein [Desulfoluna spongiiphila]SCX77555.1 ADP-heptose:LPS heptosyltransferase [Desulfoluna spongiiphila]
MNRILVVRNDKIGDFMLAWPSFAMLKASLPECRVAALVPKYTADLARLCPWIDDVIIDPTKTAPKSKRKALVEEIRGYGFDASINLFSTTYNALLVWKAGIPYRLAPATKLAQVFYTRRITQRRSKSAKPESEYNQDLVRSFLADRKRSVVEVQQPYLRFSQGQLESQRQKLAEQLSIRVDTPWVFVHAGSGGSANNLSLEQYAALISGLPAHCDVVLTAGPGEEENAKKLRGIAEEKGRHTVLYDKNDGLVDFTAAIACAGLFIAGSTGPLHIAGALDVPTVGFFPRRRSSTPLRWKPLNSDGRHLAFCPPEGGGSEGETDMGRIDIQGALAEINPWASPFL